uniref:Uncharacterized protein n=1 Tax=Meloidogyne enterolobii TaxID=390850 RepID=A0A6V7UA43_MELEN|nr:unnamed protein product [Meloidogyne enterolobii]
MSHGSNDSVLEVVKNKLLQTRAEADKAQNEVERLQRLLIEEREKQKLPHQKLQYAEKEANEAKQELVFLRQKIAQEGAAREKVNFVFLFGMFFSGLILSSRACTSYFRAKYLRFDSIFRSILATLPLCDITK